MNVTYGHVGDRLQTAEEMNELPVGSTMHEVGYEAPLYTKIENGRWQRQDRPDMRYASTQFQSGGRMVIASIPDGWVSRPRPQENVDQHMWKFRDRALFSAYNHSVNYEASDAAVSEMGAPLNHFTLGHGVPVTDPVTRDRLPNGTVVWVGKPDNPARFGVFHKVNGRWAHLLGEAQGAPGDLTIHTYNGSVEVPEWWAREGTEADAEAIANFRAKAWQVGWRLKQSQGWCSTYEAVMRDMGLTSAAVRQATHRGIRVGDTVRPDMAHDLPNGSIFQWSSTGNSGDTAFFVRTMSSDNRAGTMRIGGTANAADGNRNYRSSMRVLYLPIPDERYGWPVEHVNDVFPLLNPGVFFGIDDHNPSYTKALDGRVAQTNGRVSANDEIPPEGRWNLRDFGRTPNMFVTGFRGVQL